MLGFCCLIILRVSSSKWHMQNFSIFTSWGILDHWLYFDGYCKVTINSQDTPLGLCWKLSENMFWQLKRLNTGLASNWFYLILTHVSHFMYFHGYCKVTSNSQYTFYWLCVVNHQNYFGQLIWMNAVLGFCWLIISRVSSSKWHMQNFSIFTSWGILDHWLYFDGYCEVTSNSQDTSLGLCVENYQKICSDN